MQGWVYLIATSYLLIPIISIILQFLLYDLWIYLKIQHEISDIIKIIDVAGDKQRVIMELKAPNIFRILMMDIKKRGIKRRVSVSNSRAALQKKRLGPLCCFKFLGPQFDPHLLSPISSAYSPKAECAISIIPTNTINEIKNYDKVIYLSRSRSRSYWNIATYPNSYSKAQRVWSRVLFPNIWKQLNQKANLKWIKRNKFIAIKNLWSLFLIKICLKTSLGVVWLALIKCILHMRSII